MSNAYFITTFRHLELSEQIDESFALLPGVNITTNRDVVLPLMTPQFSQMAGVIETRHLLDAPNIVFGDLDEFDEVRENPDIVLLAILRWIANLFLNAWLFTDHVMRCEIAYLTVGNHPGGALWTSNFLASRPTMADGSQAVAATMTKDDLIRWEAVNHQVESYLYNSKSSSFRFMMEKGYARSGRAMRFVEAARHAPDLSFKIAHYCSALETLFTTESTEVAHKLAERVSFFLGRDSSDRIEIFRAVKAAYNVRSKLVHGGVLQGKQIDELPILSERCDLFCRNVLNAIFNSKELQEIIDSKQGEIEAYFLDLIFHGKNKARQQIK